MRRYQAAVLILGLVFTFSPAWAKTYKIGTFPIPLMVESKDKGVFIELFKEIINRSGEKFEIVVAPPKRTVGGFHEGKLDGFFPCLDVMLQKDAAKSDPAYAKTDFAFTAIDKPKIGSIAQLEGKKVGITNGYPYARELMSNKKIKLEGAKDDIINMKKLSKGRIDAFVVDEKTGLTALQQSGAANIHYDKSKPLSRQDVFFVFQATPEGKALAAKFSKALADMKKDGKFGQIMSKAN